jgi:hypothetical protein
MKDRRVATGAINGDEFEYQSVHSECKVDKMYNIFGDVLDNICCSVEHSQVDS